MTQEITPPLWANFWGKDSYGVWVTLRYKRVKQNFRWIKPGEFWMGSPEDEEGRHEDEILHKVRLTQGFWLADTTCTQALWKAVRGDNPSRFKGKDLPVETISWNNVKDFITKLNSLVKGLELRLPTEAEWEYACRAGSKTPFAYGKEPNRNLMNFDSGKTVPVNSLYQNNWGLFQMHGNVDEWCEDLSGEYEVFNTDETVVDPSGPNTGTDHVLRGSSWVCDAEYCRSAYRDDGTPDYSSYLTGFRLASSC